MRGAFDVEEFEPARPGRDTEVTLGPIVLVGLFLGLILLCGLCFGLGYAVGRRGPANSAAANLPTVTGAPATNEAGSSSSKPSATGPNSPRPQSPAAADLSQSSTPDTASDALPPGGSPSADTAAGAGASSQPQVRPALPPQAIAVQPANGQGGGLRVEPALNQPSSLMVQIAAVSHPEDAGVLVNALRKHGYAVTARREPADGLIHVQIGPYSNRNDANAVRVKLLNDGYNAIVQP